MAERKMICGYKNREGNPDETCTGVIAHQISPRMIQIGRGDQRISVIADGNTQSTVTCPKCGRIHSIIWRGGVMREDLNEFEDVQPAPEGDPNDPNNPNNPGQQPVDPPAPAEE